MKTDKAAMLLPQPYRSALMQLCGEKAPEEIRMRAGQRATVLLGSRELELPECRKVTVRDLEAVLELATGASVHAAADSIRRGFVTAAGGLRIGLCGVGIMGGGRTEGLRQLSALAIRLPSQHRGCGDRLYRHLGGREMASTLLLAPPGAGKTTLLRELIRLLSEDGVRIALSDERGEVAAVREGLPQLDVGPRTDVMTGIPKAESTMMLLRSMSPMLMAVDEITAPEDVAALSTAANCGVTLLATAHGSGMEDLRHRPLYRRLLEERIFKNVVIISVRGGERSYTTGELF